MHERDGAFGEQHQSDIAQQGGGKSGRRVRQGGRLRAVPGVPSVRVVPVAAGAPRTLARLRRRGRGRPEHRGRRRRRRSGRSVVRRRSRRTSASRVRRRRVQQAERAAANDQRPSTVRCHVAQRFDAQTLR